MKKFSFLVLAFIVSLTFAGCGEKTPVADGENAEKTEFETKTEKYFEKYLKDDTFTAEFEMTTVSDSAESTTQVILMKKDDDMYYSFESNGVTESALIEDGYMYMLFEESKTCYKIPMTEDETDGVEDTYSMFTDADDFDEPVASGTEEIDGTIYEYETFSDDGLNITYYFSNGDAEYIKTESAKIKVISLSGEVDSSKFEIPAGYYVVDHDTSDFGV